MKLSKLGWVLAAAMVGVAIGGGFQSKTDKVGWVDMQGVFADSNLKQKNDDHLRNVELARRDILDYLGLYPGFNVAQLARFRELGVKETRTPAEATELEKIKADAKAASAQFGVLREKQSPTAQELTTLEDLGARNTLDAQTRTKWAREFDQELRQMQIDLSNKSGDAIKAAIAQVAKNQALTLVFRENIVIYGSKNLGPEVKKIADKSAK